MNNKYCKEWILIDDSHPKFDRWQHRNGYVEAFYKGENPNMLHPGRIMGNVVKDYCLEAGISQNEFADRIGIAQGTLSNYMAGRYDTPNEVISKIESITGYRII